MRVLITGATGLVGSDLCAALQRAGHEVIAFVRDRPAARAKLGEAVELLEVSVSDLQLRAALDRCDAVVNLAGAPVARRWTQQARKQIVASRVDLTRRIVDAIGADGPKTLVSASAVGIYGDRGDEELSVHSSLGEDWLAGLCVDWEREAQRAAAKGVRVVIPRIGLVLATDGGVLEKMRPVFSMGVGGRLGSGEQWMPWIHLTDLRNLIVFALEQPEVSGVLEACGPNPVRNQEFTKSLGRTLNRPAMIPVPTLALRLVFGGAAGVMVASQRVLPTRTRSLGFRFTFSQLDVALGDLLG